MNCKEVQTKWNEYIAGECSPKSESEIEKHLQTCPACDQLLNKELENQQQKVPYQKVTANNGDALSELPIKRQYQLIQRAKWKNRLKTAFTALVLLVAVMVVSTMLTGVYYLFDSKASKATEVIRIGTQMTMPNVYINGTGISTNVFFSADVEAHMERVLGNEEQAVGKVRGRMKFNNLSLRREWVDGHFLTKLYFLHPHDRSPQPNYNETYAQTWEALDILPEGTVSELAISFDDLYEIDDVQQFLIEYDLHIPWYAIHTGSEHLHELYLSNNRIFGVHDRIIFDVSENSRSETRSNGEEIGEIFKEELQFLAKNEKMAKRFLWNIDEDTNFDDMYKYVNENGIKTYGVVVTGPTKELLKLKENEHINYATLGEVEDWNWYNRPAYGKMN